MTWHSRSGDELVREADGVIASHNIRSTFIFWRQYGNIIAPDVQCYAAWHVGSPGKAPRLAN